MAMNECDLLFSIGTALTTGSPESSMPSLPALGNHPYRYRHGLHFPGISMWMCLSCRREAITKMAEYVEKCNTGSGSPPSTPEIEHPSDHEKRQLIGPLISQMRSTLEYDEAILVTDVGQHQMLVSQYAAITEKKKAHHVRRQDHGPAKRPPGHRSKSAIGHSGYHGLRRRRYADEHPGAGHRSYLGGASHRLLHFQQHLSRHGASETENATL